MKRRDFLKTAALSSAALAMERGRAYSNDLGRKEQKTSVNSSSLPRRPYGKTGINLSVIGFGGIVIRSAEQEHANRVVAEAVERGVNYFDVAPSYGDAEVKLGPALEPYRKNCFLACKTAHRNRKEAEHEFQQSLQRLRTDYFDLYQLHAITDVEKDVDSVFQKGGTMELIAEAKKAGKIHHVGFSAHSEEAALAAMNRYDFDSILFPINFATYMKGNFGPQVIPAAQSKGIALLALKALAKQRWPKNHLQRETYSKCWYEPVVDACLAELALKFTLSQPITAALPPGEESLFKLALDLAPKLQQITKEEEQELASLAEGLVPLF